MNKANKNITVIFLISFLILGCSFSDAVIEQAVAKTMAVMTEAPTQVIPTLTAFPHPTTTNIPTATRRPTAVSVLQPTKKSCASPTSITINMKGQSVEVCGTVTDVGTVPCPTCYYGEYSYMILDNSLRIISYDWILNPGWEGSCVRVKDKVESLSNKPIFVLGMKEGFDGSECTIDVYGSQLCYMEYFQECK